MSEAMSCVGGRGEPATLYLDCISGAGDNLDAALATPELDTALSTSAQSPTRGDVIVGALCLIIVAFWTVRALRSNQSSDMGLAWIAGDTPISAAAVPMEALSQFARYVLVGTALHWYARHPRAPVAVHDPEPARRG